jgi:hypothetical protein
VAKCAHIPRGGDIAQQMPLWNGRHWTIFSNYENVGDAHWIERYCILKSFEFRNTRIRTPVSGG